MTEFDASSGGFAVPDVSRVSIGAATSRPRVLHLIDTSMAHPYLLSFAKHGSHKRLEYIFGTLAPPGELHLAAYELGVESFGLSLSSRRSYPLAITRLVRYLVRAKVDIVQTHLFDPSVVGLVATRLARAPLSVFTAHHVHEWEVAGLGSRRAAELDRLIRMKLADHVIAPSDYIGRVLVDADGRTDADMTVIPHGIDLDRFAVAQQHRASARAELALGESTVLGTIGRASPVKNYPVLLRAFAELAAAEPSLMLVIAGQGDTQELRALARTLGVGDRVRFLGWRRDVRPILAAFDVFVHPALAEAFGFVLLEALAAGLPVVSTPVGIASVLIETGVTGVLLASPREDEIVAGLKDVLRRRDAWTEMGLAGRERARPYSEARMVAAHEALYEGLVSRHDD